MQRSVSPIIYRLFMFSFFYKYRSAEAAGEFAELTREVSAVSILIQDLEEQAASPSFARNQQDSRNQAKLRSLIDSIAYRLRDLKQLATKYSSLSTAKKNNWDRLRFGTNRIDDIRARLTLHTTLVQTRRSKCCPHRMQKRRNQRRTFSGRKSPGRHCERSQAWRLRTISGFGREMEHLDGAQARATHRGLSNRSGSAAQIPNQAISFRFVAGGRSPGRYAH